MSKEPYVILKGRKDGIDIFLSEKPDFEDLKQYLRKKVTDARQFFDGANTHVTFKGRGLTEDEEKALLGVIFTETSLDVSFVADADFTAVTLVPGDAAERAVAPAHAQYTEHVTAYYQSGLRSGQSIRYNGSVVIMGDVNPGSEIVANGNIVVLGALKGMVHAGAAGDDRCFVSALSMSPTQLRIANIITYIPQAPGGYTARAGGASKQAGRPSYAYIQNGQVYIAPLID